jgi:hypothetical protein
MMTQTVEDILLMMLQSICVLYYCDVALFLSLAYVIWDVKI